MFERRRRSRFAEITRSTVVLHLKTGRSIAGILIAEYDDVYALSNARLLSGGDAPVIASDGETLVPVSGVEWAQVGVKLDDWKAVPSRSASTAERTHASRNRCSRDARNRRRYRRRCDRVRTRDFRSPEP